MFEKIKGFLFKNQNARQTVIKNSFWLSVASFGGRAIKAVIIIYAARALGASEYGVFSYVITLAGFFGLFMDFGIDTVLVRETAKSSPEERRNIFSAALVMKMGLLAVGASVITFIAPYFSTLPGARILLPAAAFILTFDTLRELFFSLLNGLEKMEWVAGVFLFSNLAVVIFGFIFITHSPTALALSWGYATGTILGAIAAIIVAREYIKNIFARFSARLAANIMQAAWPFAIAGALGLLLTNTDILIISWMKTASDVGIYSAAIRIVQVLYILPGVVWTSTLPFFSRLARDGQGNDAKFRLALERSVSMIFLLSLPMAIGGILLGTPIISLIFGSAFASGGTAFKILMATLVVDYPYAIMVSAIFAYGHQKSLITTSALAGVVNIALDLLFIPRWGMTGSAVATLIAQALSNGYLWYVMYRINPFSILPHLKKIGAASAVMFLATASLVLLNVNVIVNIALSIVVYFGFLKIFRDPLLAETIAILPFHKEPHRGI